MQNEIDAPALTTTAHDGADVPPAHAEASPRKERFLVQFARHGRAGAADYVFQVLILIVGVFLGITLEEIASNWDKTNRAQTALGQLAGDLRRDDADFTRIIEAQRLQSRDFDEIASWLARSPESGSDRIDSLFNKVIVSGFTVYPRRGVYTSMITAGQTALIPDSLANSVVNLYENVYTRLATNGEHYDYYLEREFMPAYARAWDPMRKSLITADATERVRLRNTTLLMRGWSQYYTSLAGQSQMNLRAVLKQIEE